MPEKRILAPKDHQAEVNQFLEKGLTRIMERVPSYFDDKRREYLANRIAKIVLTISKKPGMNEIAPKDFLMTAYRAAEIGLDPEPSLGQMSLVPFGKTLQIIVGYKGYFELSYRSGRVKRFDGDVIWKEDQFTYERGLHPDLKHHPNLDVPHAPDEDPAYAYALAELTTGGIIFEVMPTWRILQYRDRSSAVRSAKAYNAKLPDGTPRYKYKMTPWDTDKLPMFIKTCFRRLPSKGLPQTSDMLAALAYDFDSMPEERAKTTPLGDPIDIEAEILEAESADTEEEPPPLASQPPRYVTPEDFTPDEIKHLVVMRKALGKEKTEAQVRAWISEMKFESTEQAFKQEETGKHGA